MREKMTYENLANALQGMADLFVAEPELATRFTLTGEPPERVATFLERRAKKRFL